jgi:hypothetical protein
MGQTPRSAEIGNAFHKLVRGEENDKSLIEGFTLDEIKRALAEFARDSNMPFYKAMEIRANDLESEERLRRTSKERWKDRGIGILIGVIVAVIGGIILWLILPKGGN